MQKEKMVLPTRKVKSARYFKIIYYSVLCAVLILSMLSIAFLKNYERFIENEKNVNLFFNKNGKFSAITGDFYNKTVESSNDIQATIEYLNKYILVEENNVLDLNNESIGVNNNSVYRLVQYYKDIRVINGYINIGVKNKKPIFLVNKYVNNISKHISDDKLKYAIENKKIIPDEFYKYVKYEKEIDVEFLDENYEIIIYENENNVPEIGKKCQIKIVSNEEESIYEIILNLDGILVSLNQVNNKEQTQDYLYEIINESTINYGETLVLKESILDLLKVCRIKNWEIYEDININDYKRTYNEYIKKFSVSELNLNYYFNSTNNATVSENKLIIEKILYNIFNYTCNSDFEKFEMLIKSSVDFIGYSSSFSDYRLAVELAATFLNYDSKALDSIKQCFTASNINAENYCVNRKEFNLEVVVPKYSDKEIDYNENESDKSIIKTNLDLFKKYLDKNYKSKKYCIYLEDLNFDRLPEMLVCDYTEWKSYDKLSTNVFMIKDKKVKKIDEYISSSSLLNYDSLFFYNKNGRKYLISYDPAQIANVGSYSYKIYYYDLDGKKVLYKEKSISFGGYSSNEITDKNVVELRNDALSYIKSSDLIFNTYPELEFYNKKIDTTGMLDTEIYALQTKTEGYRKTKLKDEFSKWQNK